MPSSDNRFSHFFSQLLTGLLSVATWIGTFVIEGLWWLVQFLWWMCNFVGSLVLSLLGMLVGFFGKSNRKGLGKFAKSIQKKTSKHRAGVVGKLMSKPVRRRLLPGLAVMLLFLGGFSVYRSRQASEVEAGWWNETWIYRRGIEISNSNGGLQEDVVLRLNLDTSILLLENKIQDACEDVRVTDNAGNLLSHWVEGCGNQNTTIWVKARTIPENTSKLYIYYGNKSAINTENGYQIFDHFIDFEQYDHLEKPSDWFIEDVGSCTGACEFDFYVSTEAAHNGEKALQYYLNPQSSGSGWTAPPIIRVDLGNPIIITDDTAFHWNQFDKYHSLHVQLLVRNSNNQVRWVNYLLCATNHWRDECSDETNVHMINSEGIVHDSCSYNNWQELQRNIAQDYNYLYCDESIPLQIESIRLTHFLQKDVDYDIGALIDFMGFFEHNSAIMVSSISSEEVTPGPIAHWKFDEGTGTTAYDASGQGNDGTLVNGPTWITEDQCVVGKCLYFDGSQQVDTQDKDYLSPSNNNITVSVWSKVPHSAEPRGGGSGGGTGRYMLAKGTSANWEWGLENDNNTQICIVTWQSGGQVHGRACADFSVNDDAWHYYTATIDYLNKITLFIDGKPVSDTSSFTGTMTNNNKEVQIGRRGDGNFYIGFIDEVKIYPYARSEEQIKADYAAGLAGMSTPQGAATTHGSYSPAWMSDGLVGYWKMDESSWNGTSGEVIDASGNGNHGTALNGAVPGAGKFGNGGSFDGVDDTIDIDDDVSLKGMSGISISFWMNKNDTTTAALVDKNRGSEWNIHATSSFIRFEGMTTGGKIRFTTINSYNISEWIHIVATYNENGEKHIYFNSVNQPLSVQNDNIGPIATSTNLVRLGGMSGGHYLNGSIDEVRIYNRALSPAEVKALYEWAPGPVAHYTFDSGDNTTVDDISGYGNNGSWSGSTSERYAPGKFGSAGVFNGSDDYINFEGNAFIPKTVSLWFKTSSSANLSLISPQSGGGNPLNWGIHLWAGKIRFYSDYDAEYKFVESENALNDNVWHHVTGVSQNGTTTLYINGRQQVGDTETEMSLGHAVGYIGAHYKTGDPTITKYFNGLIDDVRIYNYARTQQQILEDMQGGPPSAVSIGGGGQLNPIAHWRFDEGYGTTAHDSVGDNDGTINGASWSNEGRVGKALSFNGTSDKVTLNSAIDFPNITISAWINPKIPLESYSCIFSNLSHSNDNGYLLTFGSTTLSNLRFYVGNELITFTNSSITAGNWYHLVASWDGSIAKIYVDGNLATSGPLGTPAGYNGAPNMIGDYANYNFNGLIDEVKIYNYALSPEEVKLDYNQGMSNVMGVSGTDDTGAPTQAASAEYCIPGDTSHCAPPVAEWLFNENQGSVARDTSGNGNDGTLMNMSDSNWVPGVNSSGSALNLQTNHYVSASNITQLNSSGFTASGWIKIRSQPNHYSSMLISSTSGFVLYTRQNSREPWAQMYNGTSWTSAGCASEVLSLNEWGHLAITYSSNNQVLRTFFNGSQCSSDVIITEGMNSAYNTTLNMGTYAGNYHDGLIDDVKIYDYARTPAQIAWDYNRGSPVGHWRFDECQGTTAHDISGNDNHGAINIGGSGSQTSAGTCTSGNSAHAWNNGSEGRINSAMSFDGVDDYVLLASNSMEFVDEFKPRTISFFLKMNTMSGYQMLFSGINNIPDQNAYNGNVQINDGVLQIIYGQTSNSNNINTNSRIDNNEWTHITIVDSDFEGTSSDRYSIYINGQLADTNTNATSRYVSDAVAIGRRFWTSTQPYFDGLIDDVRIYNYALTDEQVKLLYNDGAVKFGN